MGLAFVSLEAHMLYIQDLSPNVWPHYSLLKYTTAHFSLSPRQPFLLITDKFDLSISVLDSLPFTVS